MIDQQELELFNKHKLLIGIDEVGLGCLSGPIVSCAVVIEDLEALHELLLKPKRKIFEVGDSKEIPEYARKELAETLKKVVSDWCFGIVSTEEINHVKNIYKCGFIARYRAAKWKTSNGLVCIDGPFGNLHSDLPSVSIVGGDKKFKSIGAASILAKVFRDELMVDLHKEYPYYNWENNKGYGSIKHFEGLQNVGACKFHRFHVAEMNKYFRPCDSCGVNSCVLDGKKYKCLICGKLWV